MHSRVHFFGHAARLCVRVRLLPIIYSFLGGSKPSSARTIEGSDRAKEEGIDAKRRVAQERFRYLIPNSRDL
jgi:hypothetical protein